jgi:hypothetical protein
MDITFSLLLTLIDVILGGVVLLIMIMNGFVLLRAPKIMLVACLCVVMLIVNITRNSGLHILMNSFLLGFCVLSWIVREKDERTAPVRQAPPLPMCCGQALPNNANYCPHCGAAIGETRTLSRYEIE